MNTPFLLSPYTPGLSSDRDSGHPLDLGSYAPRGYFSATTSAGPMATATNGSTSALWSPVTPGEAASSFAGCHPGRRSDHLAMGAYSDLDDGAVSAGPEITDHSKAVQMAAPGLPTSPTSASLQPMSLLTALLQEKRLTRESRCPAFSSDDAESSDGRVSAAASRATSRTDGQCGIMRISRKEDTRSSGKISFGGPLPMRQAAPHAPLRSLAGSLASDDHGPLLQTPPRPLDLATQERVPTPILKRDGQQTPLSSAPPSRRPSQTRAGCTASTAKVQTGLVSLASSLEGHGHTGSASDARPLSRTRLTFAVACPMSTATSPPGSPTQVLAGTRSRRSSAASISNDTKIGRLGLGVGTGAGGSRRHSLEPEIEEGDEDDASPPRKAISIGRGSSGSFDSQAIQSEDDSDSEAEESPVGEDQDQDTGESAEDEDGASGYEEDSEASDADEFVKESRVVSPPARRMGASPFSRPCWAQGTSRAGSVKPHFSPSALIKSVGIVHLHWRTR